MPKLVDGVDMRSLPIGPEEAFVLSRVDGRSSPAEIAAATGIDAGRVGESLARLVELGAVDYSGAAPPPPKREEPAETPPSRRLAQPVLETTSEAPSTEHPAAALYDPGELDEDVELDLPRKRKILDYYYRLDSATHYELLGVAADAERKTIKEAYFKIVGLFHPDKYFGKRLGSFKTKLERVFQRLTEAEDVLSRRQTRDEYDAYLATVMRTRKLEQAMSDEELRSTELERARRLIEQEARLAERISQSPPGRGVSWPPAEADPEARKRALARKLRGSMAPPERTSQNPPSGQVSRAAIQEHVADELKKRYEARLAKARDSQVKKYVEVADGAIEAKDLISAANALRLAVSLAPEDEALKKRYDDTHARATSMLADTYLEQAKYEESNKHWLEAALSYERASRGKPTAVIFGRAAYCLLEGGGDMRKASEFARKAVGLAPKSNETRLTLARIYVKAGMKESALAEFERLSQAQPDDDTIKDWIKRIKRGDV